MLRYCVALLASVALVTACSTTSPSEPSDACSSYFGAVSAHFARCKGPGSDRRPPESVSACRIGVAAPGAGALSDRLAACAAKLRDLPCNQNSFAIAECQSDAAAGTLAEGMPCWLSLQCASNTCLGPKVENNSDLRCGTCAAAAPLGGACGKSTNTQCTAGLICANGRCISPRIGNEGDPCPGIDSELPCAPNLHCASIGLGPGACRRPLAEGAPCSGHECGGELVCIVGACHLRGGVGTPCVTQDECAPDFACDDSASPRCVAAAKLNEGQACSSAPEGWCNDGLYCETDPKGGSTCKAYKPKGAACNGTTDQCTALTLCLGGTCKIPDPSTCR